MKKMLYSVALIFSVIASCAFADGGAKVVASCSETGTSTVQSGYEVDSFQVFQEEDGSYRYSASITPSNEAGATVGAPTYSSSGEVVTTSNGFGEAAFKTSDGSIYAAYIGCAHSYIFDDQNKDEGMQFDLSSCQFN